MYKRELVIPTERSDEGSENKIAEMTNMANPNT